MSGPGVLEEIRASVAAVDDPEFPGVSIGDLGLVQDVRFDAGSAHADVDLVPTFLGCPALDVIADDVRRSVAAVASVDSVSVRFVSEPVWTPDRVSPRARQDLGEQFTVAVPSQGRITVCPVCGSSPLQPVTPFGPTACRAVARCASCMNPVEVMKG